MRLPKGARAERRRARAVRAPRGSGRAQTPCSPVRAGSAGSAEPRGRPARARGKPGGPGGAPEPGAAPRQGVLPAPGASPARACPERGAHLRPRPPPAAPPGPPGACTPGRPHARRWRAPIRADDGAARGHTARTPEQQPPTGATMSHHWGYGEHNGECGAPGRGAPGRCGGSPAPRAGPGGVGAHRRGTCARPSRVDHHPVPTQEDAREGVQRNTLKLGEKLETPPPTAFIPLLASCPRFILSTTCG